MAGTHLDRVSFIVLRHMRVPIILLIAVYSIAMLGMVLVPGLPDENGNTTYMSFFHAYYFLAYTATTTGFGELPGEFSNAQRLWAVFCLYVSVVSWLYGIGKIISLVKNPHFQFAIAENRFARAVSNKKRPFYLVCGFGDTGSLLLRGLTDNDLSAVVLDEDYERIKALDLRNYKTKVLGLNADASNPRFLIDAGIQHEQCVGVLVLSNSENVNLKVAVSARLLRPEIKIICRSTSEENEAEILAIGGDTHVVDPFRVFASYLSLMIYNPSAQTLNEWFAGAEGAKLDHSLCPLLGGKWVLCGHGRMGKVVYRKLTEKGIEVTVVEPLVENIEEIADHAVLGKANKKTLQEAGLKDCVGVIAGTDNDTFNLSMVHQANQINPQMFSIVRQNRHTNEVLFKHADVDYIMQPSLVIARMVLFRLIAPLMKSFFNHLKQLYENDPTKLAQIVERLAKDVGGEKPLVKTYVVSETFAPAMAKFARQGQSITLGDMTKDPALSDEKLKLVTLVHKRGKRIRILPEDNLEMEMDDEILVCMKPEQQEIFESNVSNEYTLHFLLTGEDLPRGAFFEWWAQQREN